MAKPKQFNKRKIEKMTYNDFFKTYHREICNQTNYDNIVVIQRCYNLDEKQARVLYNNWKEKYLATRYLF